MDETRIYRQGYHLDEPTPNTGAYKSILQAYTGDLDDIKWDDDDPGEFKDVDGVLLVAHYSFLVSQMLLLKFVP